MFCGLGQWCVLGLKWVVVGWRLQPSCVVVQDQHVRSMCISRAELPTFCISFPASSYLSFFRSEWGFRIWVEICSSHVLSRRAARSLRVSRRGATIVFVRALSGCRCLEDFPPRVGMSYVSGDMQFSCIAEKSDAFAVVDRQGGASDFFQKLSCCQLSELFQLRVGVSYLGGDLQFSCVVETRSTFTSCI